MRVVDENRQFRSKPSWLRSMAGDKGGTLLNKHRHMARVYAQEHAASFRRVARRPQRHGAEKGGKAAQCP